MGETCTQRFDLEYKKTIVRHAGEMNALLLFGFPCYSPPSLYSSPSLRLCLSSHTHSPSFETWPSMSSHSLSAAQKILCTELHPYSRPGPTNPGLTSFP